MHLFCLTSQTQKLKFNFGKFLWIPRVCLNYCIYSVVKNRIDKIPDLHRANFLLEQADGIHENRKWEKEKKMFKSNEDFEENKTGRLPVLNWAGG